MKNGIFKLDWASVGDAVLTAVAGAVITGVVSVVGTSGFDLFHTDWVMVGQNMTNLGVIAGVVALGNAWLSTDKGSLLGVGPEVG